MKVSFHDAARLLRQSHVVAIPTETVWGLAALYHDEIAIEKLYTLKKRPPQNPLIIHVEKIEDIYACTGGALPPKALDLASNFWPGPLTLVVPIDQLTIPSIVRAGLSTAAFRIPGHRGTRELIHEVGPLVAPSANLSGKPSSTRYSAIEDDFGSDFPCYIFDQADELELPLYGIESTILIWNNGAQFDGYEKSIGGWSVGRLGALSLVDIKDVLGDLYIEKRCGHANKEAQPLCPGQMFRHYAPEAQLSFGVDLPLDDRHEAIIGFYDRQYPQNLKIYRLGCSDDVRSCLRNLYQILRSLDIDRVSSAWVDALPVYQGVQSDPLWTVFLDRIGKAISKK